MQPVTVLFDAECTMCQRARGYGDGHGRPGLLRFVPNTDPEGQRLLALHGLAGREKDTMVAVVGERAYVESAAIVQVAKRLQAPHSAAAAMWLVPRPIRDFGYRWVAKRRHKLFRA